VFIEAKDDGGGGDNWTTGAISRAKLQSNHHHQQTNIQFFLQTRCPSCHSTNSVEALKGKISHSMDLLTPKLTCGLPTLSLTTNSSWLPWGGLPCLSSALWCQYLSNLELSFEKLVGKEKKTKVNE